MLASFRNFFITFVLALALFGGLAYHYYGDLLALLPGPETEENSGTDVSGSASGEESAEVSQGMIDIEDKGDGLGSINGLIVTKSETGEVMSARFVRINSERRVVVTCTLSLGAVVYNEVSATVPLRDYLRMYPGEDAAGVICSLVGYRADFYLELTPDSLDEMVSNMHNPHFTLMHEIKYVNPLYADYQFPEGVVLPTDYYKHVPNGNIMLTADTVATIREHYSVCDGTDGHESYTMLLASLYDSLLKQLFTEQKAVMLADSGRFAAVFAGAESNLTEEFLTEKGEILMKYMDSERYQTVEVAHTNRDDTIDNIKMADK